MGQTIDYALGQWDLLGRYLHDGRLEIDNNQVEPERSGASLPKAARRASAARQNAIRPAAVGKKNWLFIGHADCGQRGAILFTIVQACRQRGINPFDSLKDVLTQIPHHTNKTVAQLTPENWLKNRQSYAARAASLIDVVHRVSDTYDSFTGTPSRGCLAGRLQCVRLDSTTIQVHPDGTGAL